MSDPIELETLEAMDPLAAEPDVDMFQTMVKSLPGWVKPTYLTDMQGSMVELVDAKGVKAALKRLNDRTMQELGVRFISNKSQRQFGLTRVTQSTFAAYTHGAQTKLVVDQGVYPTNAGPRRVWIRQEYDLAKSSNIVVGPIVIQQLHQNAGCVVQGPDGQVYIIENSFVAFGQYQVLGVVNQLQLKQEVIDNHSNILLGHYETVSAPGAGVVATFVRVPQGNLATASKDSEFGIIPAGNYILAQKGVKLGTFMTTKESEATLANLHSFTKDKIPLIIDLHLKWSLRKPLRFVASTNFVNCIDLLEELVQSVLLSVVSEHHYRIDVGSQKSDDQAKRRKRKSRKAKGEADEEEDDGGEGLSFVRRVSSLVLKEIQQIAAKYGILVISVSLRNITFPPQLAKELDSLARDVATQQSRAMLVSQKNATALKEAEGQLKVAEVAGRARAGARIAEEQALLQAELEASKLRAESAAQALRIESEAKAKSIRMLAEAEASIEGDLARRLALMREDVKKWQCLSDKHLVIFGDSEGAAQSSFSSGMSAALAAKAAGGFGPNRN